MDIWYAHLRENTGTSVQEGSRPVLVISNDIYQILPQLIELWGLNVQTEVESRKNLEKVSGK